MRRSRSTQDTDIFARFERQSSNPKAPRDRFEAEDFKDAERVLKWLNGEDMSREKRWIVKEKNIPAAWYALQVLAKENGITSLAKVATFGKYDQRWHAVVTVQRGHGKLKRVHIGASSFGGTGDKKKDRQIALSFAARNAVRQLLPQQPNTQEQVAWRGDKKEGLKHI